MAFIEMIKQKAKEDLKTIVLPESTDIRVLKAACKVVTESFANVVLLGDKEKIEILAKENGIDISGIKIITPEKDEKYNTYVESRMMKEKNYQ